MADDDLLGATNGNGKLRKAPKKRAQVTPEEKLRSGSPVVRLEGAFQLAFERTWGFPVIINYGRDRKLLQDLVDQLGEEGVAALIPRFFAAVVPVQKGGDPVVSRCRASDIADFKYHVPHLRMKAARGAAGDMSERTAANVDAAMKATGRK